MEKCKIVREMNERIEFLTNQLEKADKLIEDLERELQWHKFWKYQDEYSEKVWKNDK